MARRSSTRGGEQYVERYVEAMRAWRALEQAQKDDGVTEDRTRALNEAKATVSDYRKLLTGGQIGKAHRILDGREPEVRP